MYKNLIIKYIPKITIDDIICFGKNNDVVLTTSEANLILKTIKTEYNTLLSNNYMSVFDKLKSKVSKQCYDKSLSLFLIYNEKYKIF